jgi:hypothetical protein
MVDVAGGTGVVEKRRGREAIGLRATFNDETRARSD